MIIFSIWTRKIFLDTRVHQGRACSRGLCIVSSLPHTMRIRLLAALCVSLGVVALEAKYNPTKCLEGEKHKEVPSPEGDDYKACLAYRDRTCCTAKFTEQLAQATVTSIDNFHWNRCGALSKSCEAFMIHVECFYR